MTIHGSFPDLFFAGNMLVTQKDNMRHLESFIFWGGEAWLTPDVLTGVISPDVPQHVAETHEMPGCARCRGEYVFNLFLEGAAWSSTEQNEPHKKPGAGTAQKFRQFVKIDTACVDWLWIICHIRTEQIIIKKKKLSGAQTKTQIKPKHWPECAHSV